MILPKPGGKAEQILHAIREVNKTLVDVRVAVQQLRRDFEKDAKLSAGANSLGLVRILPDSDRLDYDRLIEQPRRLIVQLNDGRTWASVHHERLRRRLEDPAKDTTIFLVHPDSEIIPLLARKGSTDPEILRGKIKETLNILREVAGPGNLEVLGHSLYNPHSLIMGDEDAVVIPYFTSRGSRSIPAFLYRATGGADYFSALESDLESLRVDSEPLLLKPPHSAPRLIVVNQA